MNELTFAQKYEAVFKELAVLENEAKDLDKKRKAVKAELVKAMEENGIKSVENDIVKITYVAPTVTIGIDTKAFQFEEPKKYEKILSKYSKETKRSAYVKITAK